MQKTGKSKEKCIFFYFFAKKFGQFKKKQYFCTRFRLKEAKNDLSNTKEESGNSSVGRARPCQGRGREFESRFPLFFFAQMAELVDACVSGAHAARCAGSSPVLGTKKSRAGGEIGIHATLRG